MAATAATPTPSAVARRTSVVLLLVVSVALAAPGGASVAATPPTATGVGGDSAAASHEPSVETVDVVVRFDDVAAAGGVTPSGAVSPVSRRVAVEHARADAMATLDQRAGVTVVDRFWLANAVLVELDTSRTTVEALSSVPGVDHVHPNFEIQLAGHTTRTRMLDVPTDEGAFPGVTQVHAPAAWEQFDTRGSGVRVAVLDTGVDTTHPSIDLAPDGWAEFDAQGHRRATFPNDDDGHGTHVSGTVAGDPVGGVHLGVAPDATLLHGKVLTDGGGTFAQVLAGMEWAVEQDADVVTMSFGIPATGGSVYEPAFVEPIRTATDLGVVVVTSSGNYGDGATGSPGNVYEAVAVGAVDDTGSVPAFSSGETVDTDAAWGPTAPDEWPEQYVVPDVAAPGVGVVSTAPDDGFATFTGTSMAAPHAAGAVALVRAAAPNRSAAAVVSALRRQAWHPDPGATSDTRYGHGVVDAHGATVAAVSDASVVGDVRTPAGDPVAGATVTTTSGVVTRTDGEGRFELPVLAGTRSVTVTTFGGVDTTETVTVAAGQQAMLNVTVQPEPTIAVVVGQPGVVGVGESFAVDLQVAHAETISVTVDAAGDESVPTTDVSLTIGGTPVEPGVAVPVTTGGTVNLTVSVDANATPGSLRLRHTVDGPEGMGTATTGPTDVLVDPSPPDVRVVALEFDPVVGADRLLQTSAVVENAGDRTGTASVSYAVSLGGADADETFDRTLTLDGGEKTTVSWNVYLDGYAPDVGTQTVSVADSETTVPFVYRSERIVVSDVSAPTVLETEPLVVTANVTNVGDLAGEAELRLGVDGHPRGTTLVTVAPGTHHAVSFEVDDEALGPGAYQFTVTGPENERHGSVDIVDAPSIEDYTDADGIVTTAHLRTAIEDWRAGRLETVTLREILLRWRTGDPVGVETRKRRPPVVAAHVAPSRTK